MYSIINTDTVIDGLTTQSITRVRQLMDAADNARDQHEKTSRKRITKLMRDPSAIKATITMSDEVMRITEFNSAARIFRKVSQMASIKGFGPINWIGLKVLGLVSFAMPYIAVKLVHQRVRILSKELILNSENKNLAKHLAARKEMGISLNINVLGEAVLGDSEAAIRLNSILEMMRRAEVNCVSVKLSAIVAQLSMIDFAGSVNRVSEKMRILYRTSQVNNCFVNLDMEEYRDLALTVAAFKEVLSEVEFETLNAGIVLQAYLPESHRYLAELVHWSQERFTKTGAHIKIRLVKGANLAMERAEAELHGWSPAPYRTKSDVDSSYARLLDTALRPEHAKAVRIGVATHNLFHLAWALEIGEMRGILDQIDVEMLEGMANSEAVAVSRSGQPVLLYAPVTNEGDFVAAIAYLVRRLDENTSDENYLKAAFEISKDATMFAEQKMRFLNSVQQRHTITTASLRHLAPVEHLSLQFINQPNIDPSDPEFMTAISKAFTSIRNKADLKIPLVIGGHVRFTESEEEGTDPSDNNKVWYHYCVGDTKDVDIAIRAAQTAQVEWDELTLAGRTKILLKAADVMHLETATTMAMMARDAGKTVAEAAPEVSEAIDFARFYATNAQEFDNSTPLGIVLVVPPWNFPYAIAMGGVCAALAAGNSVILKPAPETVATAWEIVSHLWAGGVPKDVLQFLPMRDDENGKYLVSHPEINGVILTGSFETATLFTSWRSEINLLAETSGKNAILISACADIDGAVKDLVQSAFGHAGQKCSAASIAIVDTHIYNDPAFRRQLKDAVESLNVGAGWELSTTIGPIIREPEIALMRALTQLDVGESWLIEPKKLDLCGLQWRPGVKMGVKAGSWSYQNEWFGPVLAVTEAPNFKTAVAWQNETEFGLTAGIHSLDETECEQWISSVEAGNLYVNRGITGAIVNRQPFGGWKKSSVGPNAKAGGLNYLNTLRYWPGATDVASAIFSANSWWRTVGSQAIDRSNLTVERNYSRFRRYPKPILVVIDESTPQSELTLLRQITTLVGAKIEITSSIEKLGGDFARVRWLSLSVPPILEMMERGITVDRRPIAQRGDIEAPRWLQEQAISITHHRYGNKNGGPKPKCLGLVVD